MDFLSVPLWKRLLRSNFTRWQALADFLELSAQQRNSVLERPRFILNVPLRLAHKMVKKTLDDPLLKQFLPVKEEQALFLKAGYVSDPVGDSSFRCAPKLLHKYQGRALLLCSSACAMHCRYCFRQNFDYAIEEKAFQREIALIKQDASIREAILSGGDPLSLSDASLKELLNSLDQIDHIKRIRFHTRFPIGIPERIDDSFLKILAETKKQTWFIVHVNHPRELDEEILSRLKAIQKLGVPTLNQTVLLKGVNDDVSTLGELCETLADAGILPYYLHQLDRVAGAERFEVSEEKGKALIKELSLRLSGYAVPKYVREIAGEGSKTALFP